jgi:hypothetical protein
MTQHRSDACCSSQSATLSKSSLAVPSNSAAPAHDPPISPPFTSSCAAVTHLHHARSLHHPAKNGCWPPRYPLHLALPHAHEILRCAVCIAFTNGKRSSGPFKSGTKPSISGTRRRGGRRTDPIHVILILCGMRSRRLRRDHSHMLQ